MANTFEKAFAREFGKNTAKVVSNALYRDHWSTPYRRVGSGSSAASARAERARIEAESRAEQARIEANARAERERQNQLNLLDSAVIDNMDKLNEIPIPYEKGEIIQLLSMLSVQMRSIKLEKGGEEAEIRNKYLFALVEKYRQCIFELQCLDSNDPHLPTYGQILEERVHEINYHKTKCTLKSIYKWMAIVAGVLLFLFIPMDGGNKDGSWNIPQYIINLDVIIALLLLLAIPVISIIAKSKAKKTLKNNLLKYEVSKKDNINIQKCEQSSKCQVKKNATSSSIPIENSEIIHIDSHSFEVVDGLDENIFFDLNDGNRIGNALGQIWNKYYNCVPLNLLERKPIFAADGVKDSILFIGVNPSFDPSDDDYFLKNDDGKSLLYGSFYKRKDSPGYFAKLEAFASQLGKAYVHMNLLYVRENDRDLLFKIDGNFIREQLELTYDTIVRLQPKAIVFFTTYCKKLIFGKGRWVNPENTYGGQYILNGTNIPVFFSEDITGMSSLQQMPLLNEIKKAIN